MSMSENMREELENDPLTQSVTSKEFAFASGTVTLIYQSHTGHPRATHGCKPYRFAPTVPKEMNICFGNDRYVAILFCPSCGERIYVRWPDAKTEAELKLAKAKLEADLELAANCSWPGSDKMGPL